MDKTRKCIRLSRCANLVARLSRVALFFFSFCFRATFASMVKQPSVSDAYALLGLEQVGKSRDHRRLAFPVLNPFNRGRQWTRSDSRTSK